MLPSELRYDTLDKFIASLCRLLAGSFFLLDQRRIVASFTGHQGCDTMNAAIPDPYGHRLSEGNLFAV